VPVDIDDRTMTVIRELVAGSSTVVCTAFAALVVFPHGSPAEHVLIMATAVGSLAAVVSDWRARTAIAALSVPAYLWVSPSAWGVPPWQFTPLIAVAVMLGAGYRCLTHPPQAHQPR
jgi:hypothetical protein